MAFICKFPSVQCLSRLTLCASNHNRRYSSKPECYDVVIIGGGIVGAASARELIMRHPYLKMALIEKENKFAAHQSSHNSGVMHAGIYYKPGSLRAKLCVQGIDLAVKYCDEKGIKYKRCGKMIVATKRSEVPRLLGLYEKGLQNGVKGLRLLDPKEMSELEPQANGVQALWSPNTGIVDWGEVTHYYIKDFEHHKGKTYLNFEAKEFIETDNAKYPILITDKKNNAIQANHVLTCCGLHSDEVAKLTGCPEEPRIIPFRGEYLCVVPQKSNMVKANIYPVPDPRFPFLGVHVTPTVDGRIILGPNAILALSKEGYKWYQVNFKEMKDILSYSGFRKLALQYVGLGLSEWFKSFIIPLQVRHLQKYVKNLKTADCIRGPTGVRAQAMSRDGNLIEDFVFDSKPGTGAISSRVLHCRNAPSPGATSSMAIAKMIADRMEEQFKV